MPIACPGLSLTNRRRCPATFCFWRRMVSALSPNFAVRGIPARCTFAAHANDPRPFQIRERAMRIFNIRDQVLISPEAAVFDIVDARRSSQSSHGPAGGASLISRVVELRSPYLFLLSWMGGRPDVTP